MKKTLVAFFSASGVTKKAAMTLAQAIEADVFEIEPEISYTTADLNWNNPRSRSSIEMNDESYRPKIKNKIFNIDEYDTIFLGFPIWWYVAPRIIQTFLESYDFSGKTIVLFATSGGSGLGKTADVLKESVSDSTKIISGKVLNGRISKTELASWAKKLGIS